MWLFTHAIVRKPGADFAQGITTAQLGAPDDKTMLRQHASYVATLQKLGLRVLELEPLPGFPDAYFVEDCAVVTRKMAVITRPGAEARRGETDSIAEALSAYRKIHRIHPPGTLDGGDVLQIGEQFFIGLSQRTNLNGAEQLVTVLKGHDYDATLVPVSTGLHLKSGVNYAGKNTVVLTEPFSKELAFATFNHIIVEPEEAYAANLLWINGVIVMAAGFPRLRKGLASLESAIIELDVSEARKMDGGLTCMSLRF